MVEASLVSIRAGLSESKGSQPHCDNAQKWEACVVQDTIDVVLTVLYHNAPLEEQLAAVSEQSMVPMRVMVVHDPLVIEHDEIHPVIRDWQSMHNHISIFLVQFSSKLRGRFSVAYLNSDADYVSIWDHDIIPQKDWLKSSVEYSKKRRNALVGGQGRLIKAIMQKDRNLYSKHRKIRKGRADFIADIWTLKRQDLRHYLGVKEYTDGFGEAVQLSYALQKQDISTWSVPQKGSTALTKAPQMKDKFTVNPILPPKDPSEWLYCKLLLDGFRPKSCRNCDTSTANRCLRHFSSVKLASDKVLRGLAEKKSAGNARGLH